MVNKKIVFHEDEQAEPLMQYNTFDMDEYLKTVKIQKDQENQNPNLPKLRH